LLIHRDPTELANDADDTHVNGRRSIATPALLCRVRTAGPASRLAPQAAGQLPPNRPASMHSRPGGFLFERVLQQIIYLDSELIRRFGVIRV